MRSATGEGYSDNVTGTSVSIIAIFVVMTADIYEYTAYTEELFLDHTKVLMTQC